MDDEPSELWIVARLRGEERGRIRRLGGFIKGSHHEPDHHHPAAEAFVRRSGEPEVQARAEDLYRRLRQAFGWKRRDLTCEAAGGLARLGTPDFSVALAIAQAPDEARCYRLEVEVAEFARPEVVGEEAFVSVFQGWIDTIAIDLPRAIDVAARIDAIEDHPRLAAHLDYPADASWLTLQTPGPSGLTLRLEAHELTLRTGPGGDLRSLIEGTGRLLAEFAEAGVGFTLEAG